MKAVITLLLAIFFFSGCRKTTDKSSPTPPVPPSPPAAKKIGHVVIIYLENHSFDNLYGEFDGANGLVNATSANTIQVDSNNAPYTYLPAIPGSTAFPANLPNTFFNIDQYVPNNQTIPDVLHRFYQEQMQIDGGKMDKFSLYNSSAGLSQGYYSTSLLPLVSLAKQYTLCDNFFHSAFGCSFLNHIWLIAAATPEFPGAPASIIASVDGTGKLIKDGIVSPDGFAVNTTYTVNTPHPANADPLRLLPNQTMPTIGDRLTEKNVSWVWYSGGWNDALAGNPNPTFQFHHQPFAYFEKYADGTQAKTDHLRDETEFIAAAKNGTLPAVSFVKPIGISNEHPGYSDIQQGENHTVDLVNNVLNGPNGKDVAIFITYDENGGFWDHVAPPVIDRWGPGTRVPTIIISPFAKRSFVDHTQYETLSILALIEKTWSLTPLNDRDKNANPFANAFSLQ